MSELIRRGSVSRLDHLRHRESVGRNSIRSTRRACYMPKTGIPRPTTAFRRATPSKGAIRSAPENKVEIVGIRNESSLVSRIWQMDVLFLPKVQRSITKSRKTKSRRNYGAIDVVRWMLEQGTNANSDWNGTQLNEVFRSWMQPRAATSILSRCW